MIWKEKSDDLCLNRTNNHHNSDVTALPVELPSLACMGARWCGVAWVLAHKCSPRADIHQGSPKGTPGMTCCHLYSYQLVSVRC